MVLLFPTSNTRGASNWFCLFCRLCCDCWAFLLSKCNRHCCRGASAQRLWKSEDFIFCLISVKGSNPSVLLSMLICFSLAQVYIFKLDGVSLVKSFQASGKMVWAWMWFSFFSCLCHWPVCNCYCYSTYFADISLKYYFFIVLLTCILYSMCIITNFF